jgi:hypothetical protein
LFYYGVYQQVALHVKMRRKKGQEGSKHSLSIKQAGAGRGGGGEGAVIKTIIILERFNV